MTDPSASSLGNALKETLEGLIESSDAHSKTEVGKLEADARMLESKIEEAKRKEQGVLVVPWGGSTIEAKPTLRPERSSSEEYWRMPIGKTSLEIRACNGRKSWNIYTGVCGRHESGDGSTLERASDNLRRMLTEYYDGLKELLDD